MQTREPWNGRDWYVAFGEFTGGRQWEDARKYGFVSGGGGKWFSRTLKNLISEARVFVYIPKVGYVGVGIVTSEARRFDQTVMNVDGIETLFPELPLKGNYRHEGDRDDLIAEWVVLVDWLHAVPSSEGFWKTGMFANQNTATKLRQRYTIDQVTAAFKLKK